VFDEVRGHSKDIGGFTIAVKRIYLELAGRFHSSYGSLISHPPEGYEFILEQTPWDKGIQSLMNKDFIYHTFQRNVLTKLLPVHLVKSYLERFVKKSPQGTDLTYSFGHLIFRKEPWILDLEWVHQLTGFSVKFLRRYHRLVENTLASDYCKRVLCYSEVAKRSVLSNLNCSDFENKVEVVYRAVPRKNFVKTYDTKKVTLLFVGSVNIPGEFYLKGGHIALEAFVILSRRHNDLELVMRSDISQDIRNKYAAVGNIRITDKIIPWEVLEHLFKSADIFLFPAHHTPAQTFLDAMSYELPVITTAVHANPELVEDGKTGLLIKGSAEVPYYIENWVAPGVGDKSDFSNAIKVIDETMVAELVEKTSILIEDASLRRRMGRAGRWEVEHGKFSIQKRNEKLKRIFDEATS
jgi:glycosyltransferase involved in cell wall biosynthesis